MIILDTLAEDAAAYLLEKGAKREMEAQSKEVMDKVKALVQTKFKGDYPAAFQFYDLDHNGKLGHKDVCKLLEDAGVGNWLTRGVWAGGVISQLDENHDGAVSIPELTLAFIKNSF